MAGTIALEDIPTEYGTISITKNTDTGALTYAVGGRRQGAADSGGTSLAYYIHAIFGLLTEAKARNILMIGGACCTLATMLERARRQATIVDVNPACFALARRYFGRRNPCPAMPPKAKRSCGGRPAAMTRWCWMRFTATISRRTCTARNFSLWSANV